MPIWKATVTLNNPDLGGTGTNTWHVRTDTGEGLVALNPMAATLEDFYTAILDIYTQQTFVRFDGEWAGVGADEGDFLQGTDWEVQGQDSGGGMPPSQCVVVGWRTDSGGRRGKGRTFLGPLGKAGLETNGTPSSAMLTQIRGAATALVDDSAGLGNGAFGVYSKEDSLIRDFTSSNVRDIYASLRSRRD